MRLFFCSSEKITHGNRIAGMLKAALVLLILAVLSFDADALTITGTTAAGLIYSASNSQVTITGYTSTLSGSVPIPSSITVSGTNMSVVNIATAAFSGCSALTSVSIPAGVNSIGNAVFNGCSGLLLINVDANSAVYSSVAGILFNKAQNILIACPGGYQGGYIIPDGITSIGPDAFAQCASLTEIVMPQGVTNIGADAFTGCVNLTTVTPPATGGPVIIITIFGAINLPDTVTSVGARAFSGCAGVNQFIFYDGLTSIGAGAFEGCSTLRSFALETGTGNSVFSTSADGVLFDKAQTTLIEYPAGKSGTYTIPNGVTTISASAFAGCQQLTAVAIPTSVTTLGTSAFYACTNLTGVSIPSSVSNIQMQAFEGCSALKSAIFIGNAPTTGTSIFAQAASGFTVFYMAGATGFSSPAWTDSAGDQYPSYVAAAPTGLTAAPGTTVGNIALNWAGEIWAQSYVLERSTSPGSGYSLLAVVSSGTSYADSDPTLVAGQTYYYEVAGAVSGGMSAYSAPASSAPFDPPTYGGWTYNHFGLNAPASETADTASPAGDGVSNLMKYSLGLNPLTPYSPVSPGMPYSGMSSGTSPCLTLTFTGTATDVTYSVQATSNLSGAWTTLYQSTVGSPPGTTTITDIAPISSSGRRFMRLQVSGP